MSRPPSCGTIINSTHSFVIFSAFHPSNNVGSTLQTPRTAAGESAPANGGIRPTLETNASNVTILVRFEDTAWRIFKLPPLAASVLA
jgi:hypothetical protein